MNEVHLLTKWKIIFGIILYIVLGEFLKDIMIFPIVEPYLFDRFETDLAERLSEFTEYFLLAAILVPIAIIFVINPVNKSNRSLVEISNETKQKNKALQIEITERKKIETEKETLIEELQNALLEIKTLKGVLPICSYCKEIRNDKGYWIRLENYIQEHSDAEFSHSICDTCLDKHFPEESDE